MALTGVGHAVEPAQPDDFTVQVIRLDRAQAPLEALPRRTAATLDAIDRSRLHFLLEARGIFFIIGNMLDSGCCETLERLAPRPLRQPAAARRDAAKRLDGIAEVRQQLAILPSHDVGLRL